MKNASDWMNEIEELYEGQKSGKIRPPQACEMNNTIGKAIAHARGQMEKARLNNQLKDKAPLIPMMENRPSNS
jgi:hypothetical protein